MNRIPASRAGVLPPLLVIALGASAFLAAGPEPLTRAVEVRSLSREQAASRLPVSIRGIVVLQIGKGRVFYLHDGAECVAVHSFKARELGLEHDRTPDAGDSEVGAVVEIEGFTDPAGYSPVVVPASIRRVGTAPVPPARKTTMERLISGSEVSQLVEIEGVVRKARPIGSEGGIELEMTVEGFLCDVKLHHSPDFVSADYIDARVKIRGCSSPIFNLRSEATAMRLIVQDQSQIEILRPPAGDPFLAPRVPLHALLPFTRNPEQYHRKVTEGVINFSHPGKFFFLQDGNSGVRVESQDVSVRVGDRVEVSGFVDTSRHIACLSEALARRIGSGVVPAPVPVTTSQLLNPSVANPLEPVTKHDHFGSLVRLTGTIRNYEWDQPNRQVRLLVDSGSTLFAAVMPEHRQPPPTRWAAGTEIDISGVCELTFEPGIHGSKSPVISGFTLWSRSPADIVVLHAPSWWTPLRLSLALGSSLAVLALALVWASMLRRQVSRQMEIISGKLHDEAVAEERNRMARDLHDTLEQQLVGVSLQLDETEDVVREDPQAALESLTLARRMLEFTRVEARRSVRDLRSQVLETQGLEAAIRALALGASHASGPSIAFDVRGKSFPLPAADAYHLLRMGQEALTNSLKHAHAEHIRITLEYTPNQIRFGISDDGRGFSHGTLDHTENSHFGLLGMRERAAKIGAELTITGKPGAGCLVSITLPVKSP